MKKYMIAIAVLALVLTLPCTAAIEQLEPITESFGFVSAKIDNMTTGTSVTNNNINVQNGGSFAFGNVMAYFTFNCQPSTNYRITVTLTNSGGFETAQYKQAEVLLNMWLHNYQDNGTWRYADNGGTNVLRIRGSNGIYTTAMGETTQFTHTNTVNYIRYSYATGIRAVDIDTMEVIFNFSTSDQTPADPSENLITFYGNIQIDNQTSDQLNSLESTIVGDPNAPTPPSVDNVQGGISNLESAEQDIFDQIGNVDLPIPEWDSIIADITGGMQFARNIFESLFQINFIYYVVFVVLLFGFIMFILRLRR